VPKGKENPNRPSSSKKEWKWKKPWGRKKEGNPTKKFLKGWLTKKEN